MNVKHLVVSSLSAVAMVAICASAAPAAAVSGTAVLADLRYASGARALFLQDLGTGERMLVQDGPVGRSAPADPSGGPLATYLALTPPGTPVPTALADGVTPAGRGLSRSAVRMSGLPARAAAALRCEVPYYDGSTWRDEAVVGLAAKTYATGDFAGKVRYVESFIVNCTPTTEPATQSARHRLYERLTAAGPWAKKYEGKVVPGFWQAVWRGSLQRKHHAVMYDDAWTAAGGCAVCRYAREGRFTNTAP